MGLYDLPAMIDLVLRTTGSQSLHFVAHSMSTTAFLVMAATRPEYNAKVWSAHLMGPAIFMRDGLARALSGASRQPTASTYGTLMDSVQGWMRRVGIEELGMRSPLIHYLAEIFCSDTSPMVAVCYAFYSAVLGKGDPKQKLPNLLPVVGAYHPGGTSLQCVEHVRALSINEKFRPFGKGVHDPDPGPEYNISAITAPVALLYSHSDGVIDPKHVKELAEKLPNLELLYEVPLKDFDHCDFMWAKDAKGLVYDAILRTMRNVESRERPK